MANEPKKKRNNSRQRNSTLLLVNNSTSKRGKSHKNPMEVKLSKKESFFLEFAREIDIFALDESFPDWILNYRELILKNIRKEFRVMCQFLKDAGLFFYIKYPLEIDGKWKFADVFIPDKSLVVLLLKEIETKSLPCHSLTDREIWFSSKFKTIGVNAYDVNRTMDILKKVI